METLDKIINLLKEQKKKQIELTDYLGISKNVFTSWKSGRNTSYTKHISKIADFLGVSTDYLLGQSDKRIEAAHNEPPLSQEKQELLDAISDLSDDDLKKAIEYVELLKLRRNS